MSARWIGTRTEDLAFFWGGPLAAAGLGLLVMAAPRLLVPLWWLWLLLGDGPHLAATWTRTYGDPSERAHRGPLLRRTLLFHALGPAVLALGWALRSPWPFQLLLGFGLLWAWHHLVRQHHGLVALYGRLDRLPAADLAWDKAFLHGFLWTLFLAFLLAYPANRAVMGIPAEPTVLLRLLALALALGAAAHGIALLRRLRAHRSARSGLYALAFAGGLSAFAFFVVGAREPLLPGAATPEQAFIATSLLGGLAHTTQYLGLVAIANRRRAAAEPAFRWGAAGRTYALLAGASLVYLLLNALRPDAPGGPFPGMPAPVGRLAVALYWGLFFHHYYLDQVIWHPSREPRLRVELGLA